MITRASRSESKRHELSSSSRSRPLNDSIQAFCHGEPGSMKSEPAPLNRHQPPDGVRHELWTVVEAHVVWRSLFEGQAIQDIDDAVGIDGAFECPALGLTPRSGRFRVANYSGSDHVS
jgi:hypothetical protein